MYCVEATSQRPERSLAYLPTLCCPSCINSTRMEGERHTHKRARSKQYENKRVIAAADHGEQAEVSRATRNTCRPKSSPALP